MKQILVGLISVSVISMLIVSCKSSPKNKQDTSKEQVTEKVKKPVRNEPEKVADSQEHPGKAVYTQYCLACHQTDGSGVPGMYPPLGPGSWVNKDPQVLVHILKNGLDGKIEVDGEVYENMMPAQPQLSDEDIADLLSYIRSDFGNNLEPITIDTVKKIKSEKPVFSGQVFHFFKLAF